ncbi:MAG: hypothetical protein WBM90_03455 [Acidimicrobiia bacterium]
MSTMGATGLGRPIDLTNVSNRWAVGISVLAGLTQGALLLLGDGDGDLLLPAMVSISVFLAWAVARELDPDHPATAILAIAIAVPIILVTSGPTPAVAAAALLGVRVMTGTVGRSLTLLDIAVMATAGIYSGIRVESWPITILIAVVLFLDGGDHSRAWAILTVAGAALVALVVANGPTPLLDISVVAQLVAIGLAMLLSIPVREVNSRSDSNGILLSARRITLARASLGSALAAGVILSGGNIGPIAPALAALTAVALGRVAARRQTTSMSSSEPSPV